MTNIELMKHWVKSSDDNFKTMKTLYNAKDYAWALFMGHLVIEKLLKGLYAKLNVEQPYAPKIHNLVQLADKCKLGISQEMREELSIITHFNINARYEDYKDNFNKRATKEYTDMHIEKIKELVSWLKAKLI